MEVCRDVTDENVALTFGFLGCNSAQPKKSAAPLFRRMLSSHEQSLGRARTAGEPAGQIAARELEVQRISGALRRADALDHDVARAIEAA